MLIAFTSNWWSMRFISQRLAHHESLPCRSNQGFTAATSAVSSSHPWTPGAARAACCCALPLWGQHLSKLWDVMRKVWSMDPWSKAVKFVSWGRIGLVCIAGDSVMDVWWLVARWFERQLIPCEGVAHSCFTHLLLLVGASHILILVILSECPDLVARICPSLFPDIQNTGFGLNTGCLCWLWSVPNSRNSCEIESWPVRGRYGSAIPLEHLLVSMRTASVTFKWERILGVSQTGEACFGRSGKLVMNVGSLWLETLIGSCMESVYIYIYLYIHVYIYIYICICIYSIILLYIVFITHPLFLIIANLTAGSGWKLIDDSLRLEQQDVLRPLVVIKKRLGSLWASSTWNSHGVSWSPETDNAKNHMELSWNGGTPKIVGLYWKNLSKWMIWGYPHFRKPPYGTQHPNTNWSISPWPSDSVQECCLLDYWPSVDIARMWAVAMNWGPSTVNIFEHLWTHHPTIHISQIHSYFTTISPPLFCFGCTTAERWPDGQSDWCTVRGHRNDTVFGEGF